MTRNEIASKLKEARIQKEMSLQDVSKAISLREHILQYIENGEFDKLGAFLYIKKYLRKYGSFLKLDSEELEGLITKLEDPFEDLMVNNDTVLSNTSKRESRAVTQSVFRWYAFIIVLLLIIGIFFYFFSKTDISEIFQISQRDEAVLSSAESSALEDKRNIVNPDPVDQSIDIPPIKQNSPVSSNELTNIDVLSEFQVDRILRNDSISLANRETGDSSLVEDNNTIPPEADVLMDLPEGHSLLTISLNNEQCWLNIVDATGKVIMNTTLPGNETYHITGVAPFNLHVGNANAISSIKINSEEVDSSVFKPKGSSAVKRFKVERKEQN